MKMSFFEFLQVLLIGPLKLLFECIFAVAFRFVGHPGLSIIALSLIMNILVLPLYKRADAMQEKARDIEAKLHDGVSHIKKAFSGDERMLILQTYYRQNHYKPTDALNGSVSLLLEIPFFMAAYQFLSNLELLNGASFGPIANLGVPDGLIVLGGMTINALPILMTVVNLVSSMIFLKGYPMKTKIQLYAMALFFLVFLYQSPSGLVFYWTLNNAFSLIKTIFYKLKNPKKLLRRLAAALGVFLIIYGVFIYPISAGMKRKVFFAGTGVVLLLPVVLSILNTRGILSKKELSIPSHRGIYTLGVVFLVCLSGVLIPSTIIAASAQEFVNVRCFYHPLWYVANSFALAAGTFGVWMGVFYWLTDSKWKVAFEYSVWILCGVALVNYMFFGTDLGNMHANLCYENDMVFSGKSQLVNWGAIFVVSLTLLFVVCRYRKAAATILLTAVIALAGMSAVNLFVIQKSIANLDMEEAGNNGIPNFQLSKTGQNVIVMMLDRGMNEYIPYIMEEKQELKEKFSGFTYYSNVISHGSGTNTGSPGLFGGYEYTPVEMNKRDKESLVSKHNEALKVLPVLFSENGYQVTVCDVPYANYQWFSDLSIYDEYPEIQTYKAETKFVSTDYAKDTIQSNNRNFFCFSVMKMLPLTFQPTVYDQGRYNQSYTAKQEIEDNTHSVGIDFESMNCYNVLTNLPEMTRITDEAKNTCLVMNNNTPHEPMMFQLPDYVPAQVVDNTQYEQDHADRFVLNGRTLKMETKQQVIHYQTNMAVMIQLGEWLDYLKENDVYDNTRIIFVSDHGRDLQHLEELIMDDGSEERKNAEIYYPLLLVKDFNSYEFTESTEFMTNADVPALATKNVIANPRNPFTGKEITNAEKFAHEQFVIYTSSSIEDHHDNTFMPSQWASVKDNIWDKENWTFYDEKLILKDHDVLLAKGAK